MPEQLVRLIVDESKWLTVSMGLAFVVLGARLYRDRSSDVPARRRILGAMNLFFGATIGTMAFGHLLAVTTKLVSGTLRGSPLVLYAIGTAVAVPSLWLVHHTWRTFATGDDRGRTTVALNGWLALTLVALGLHNLPLAAPAFLNVAYHVHSRKVLGWAIVSMAVVVHAGLFVGSLLFFFSGQNFEQFSGME
jgi:hypothetical protein